MDSEIKTKLHLAEILIKHLGCQDFHTVLTPLYDYMQEQLTIHVVSQQRKLLLGYNHYLEGMYNAECLESRDVDDYMESEMKHCEKSHLKLLAKAEAMDYLHKELTNEKYNSNLKKRPKLKTFGKTIMINDVQDLKKERPDLVEKFEKMTKEELLNQCYLECVDAINMEKRVSLFMQECTLEMVKTTYTLDSLISMINAKKEHDLNEFCYYETCDEQTDIEIATEIRNRAKKIQS